MVSGRGGDEQAPSCRTEPLNDAADTDRTTSLLRPPARGRRTGVGRGTACCTRRSAGPCPRRRQSRRLCTAACPEPRADAPRQSGSVCGGFGPVGPTGAWCPSGHHRSPTWSTLLALEQRRAGEGAPLGSAKRGDHAPQPRGRRLRQARRPPAAVARAARLRAGGVVFITTTGTKLSPFLSKG